MMNGDVIIIQFIPSETLVLFNCCKGAFESIAATAGVVSKTNQGIKTTSPVIADIGTKIGNAFISALRQAQTIMNKLMENLVSQSDIKHNL